ncbi:MAG: LytTR family transcriptional regulator DNA-binding domain-containing protein [Paludibacter sp.]|nr:LytTR family transcriptional regulator DNA-binding domain-containing protein [Paludibacter sp.]
MKTYKIILIIGLWIIFALLQILSVRPLLEIGNTALIVFFTVFVFMCIVVNFAVDVFFRYSKIFEQTHFQQVINIIALVVFSLILVIGLSTVGVFLFFSKDIFYNILKILPLEILIYILVLSLIILRNKIEIQEIIAEEAPQNEITEILPISVEKISQISVKNGAQVHIIQLGEILFIQADGDYVNIHTVEKKYLKEQTMKFFEQRLPADIFLRVHRSYIVNIEYITRIEKAEKDTQTLTLKNGEKIRASLNGYRLLKEKLGL